MRVFEKPYKVVLGVLTFAAMLFGAVEGFYFIYDRYSSADAPTLTETPFPDIRFSKSSHAASRCSSSATMCSFQTLSSTKV